MKIMLRYLLFYSIILAPFLFFSQCDQASAEQGSTDVFQPVKHVLVIGVDGMSPDGINNAPTPIMDKLMAEGARTLHARAVLPTSSSSNWASMIMGVGPEQHGITSNGWERNDYILPPVLEGKEGISPTIFSVIKDQRPELKTATIYDWSGFGRLVETSVVDHVEDPNHEDSTTLAAIKYIKEAKPNFLFVHLDHVDHAGHADGHGTESYYRAVTKADSLIGEMLKATEEAGFSDDLLVIISSDHGGLGNGHGGETLEEIEIPFILHGKGVKRGYEINYPVYQYDNPATVAFAFGIDAPYHWIGKPVISAFQGYDAPDMRNWRRPLLSPVVLPKGKGYEPAGGLYTSGTATVKLSNREPEGTLYYTVDGSTPTAASKEYTGPFELSQTTIVQAIVVDEAGRTSKASQAYFRFKPSGHDNGIAYTYYEDESESWAMLPNFKGLKALNSGTALEIRHDQIGQHRDAFWGVVFEGFIQIDTAGQYKFYLASDDGSKLYINNKEVVNNDGDHGTVERSGKIDMEPGYHNVRVEWFNGGGGYWLDAYYSGPGIPKQIVPVNKLFVSKPAG